MTSERQASRYLFAEGFFMAIPWLPSSAYWMYVATMEGGEVVRTLRGKFSNVVGSLCVNSDPASRSVWKRRATEVEVAGAGNGPGAWSPAYAGRLTIGTRT